MEPTYTFTETTLPTLPKERVAAWHYAVKLLWDLFEEFERNEAANAAGANDSDGKEERVLEIV